MLYDYKTLNPKINKDIQSLFVLNKDTLLYGVYQSIQIHDLAFDKITSIEIPIDYSNFFKVNKNTLIVQNDKKVYVFRINNNEISLVNELSLLRDDIYRRKAMFISRDKFIYGTDDEVYDVYTLTK